MYGPNFYALTSCTGSERDLNYMEVLKEVREGRFRPVYLLYGGEPFLESEILAALQERLVQPETEAFNYHTVDAGPNQVQQATGVARTQPFMGQCRLVVMRQCPLFSAGRGSRSEEPEGAQSEEPSGGQEEELLAYLQRPVPSTCLVIVAATRELDKRRKLSKQAIGMGADVECRPLREAEAAAWVQVRAKTHAGKNMGHAACALLVEKAGTDLRSLATEIEKLMLFAGNEPEITESMVQQAVSGLSQAQIFALTDALSEGQTWEAIRHLRVMLNQGDHPLKLLAAISGHFRRLVEASALARKGQNAYQVAQSKGQKPFYWEKLMKQARRYRREQLIGAMERLLETDLALKGGSQSEEWLIMETLLVDLAGGNANAV